MIFIKASWKPIWIYDKKSVKLSGSFTKMSLLIRLILIDNKFWLEKPQFERANDNGGP